MSRDLTDRASRILSIRTCIKAAEFHPQVKPTLRATAMLDRLIEENRQLLIVAKAAGAWNEAQDASDPAIEGLTDAVAALRAWVARNGEIE